MNSISGSTSTDSKSSFFPLATDSHDSLKHDNTKKIYNGKSDLANYILREIKDFQVTGRPVDIELEKFQSTFPERCQVRHMLHETGWTIESIVVKTEIPNWPEVEAVHDSTLHWKITKREK
jgi:hypothetical protein